MDIPEFKLIVVLSVEQISLNDIQLYSKHIFLFRKEGDVSFNNALNTFYLGYMALDIW